MASGRRRTLRAGSKRSATRRRRGGGGSAATAARGCARAHSTAAARRPACGGGSSGSAALLGLRRHLGQHRHLEHHEQPVPQRTEKDDDDHLIAFCRTPYNVRHAHGLSVEQAVARVRVALGERLRRLESCHARWNRSSLRMPHPHASAAPSQLGAVRVKNARGAAAFTQILVTWQRGQADFVARIRKAVPWKRDLT